MVGGIFSTLITQSGFLLSGVYAGIIMYTVYVYMMYSNDIVSLFINVWLLGFYLSCNGSGRNSLHAAIQEARFCHFCGASLPLPRVPGAARGLEWTLSYQHLSVEACLLWCQRKGQFLPSMLGLMSSHDKRSLAEAAEWPKILGRQCEIRLFPFFSVMCTVFGCL